MNDQTGPVVSLRVAILLAMVAWGNAGCGGGAGNSSQTSRPEDSFQTAREPTFTTQTHYAAGLLAESRELHRQAIEQYRAALRIDPEHLPSLFRLGVVYAQTGAYRDSITAWQRYLAVAGDDPTGYSNLGYAHELAGQPHEAEQAYRRGIAISPGNEPSRINLGLLLARQGRTEEATEHLSSVLPLAQVHYNLGAVHQRQGQTARARAEFEKALELDPTLTAAAQRLEALE